MLTKAGTPRASEWSGRERLTYAVLFILSLVVSAASAVLPPMTGVIAPLLGVPSDDWIGFIVTSFLLISGFAAIPWAYLADRRTRRNLLIVSTFFWVFWFIPILLPTTTYWTLYLFHVIAALGIGATGPLSLSITIDSVPPRLRSTTFGLLGTAAAAGYGLGYTVSGLLVELLDWQTPFLVIVVVGFAAGLLLFLTREPPRGQHDEALRELHEAGGAYVYRLKLSDIRRMWRKPSNFWLVLVGIVAIVPVASFGAWAVRWLNVDHSLGIFVATEFMALALASQIAGNAVFGRLGDKLFRRDKRGRAKLILLCSVVAGPILIGACVYPFAIAPTATIFDLLFNPITFVFFVLIFVGTFFNAGISPLIYVSAGDINPPEIRGTAMSVHLLAHVVGVSLGTQLPPSFAVVFFAGTYSPALALICLLFFGAAGLALLVLRYITGDIKVTDEDVRARVSKTKDR